MNHQEHHQSIATIAKRELISSGLAFLYVMLSMVLPLPLWSVIVVGWYVVLKCGRSFHQGMFRDFEHKHLTMDTLISMSTVTAMIWSTSTLFLGGHHFVESAVAIIFFVLLGIVLENRQRKQTTEAISLLYAQHPTLAHRKQDDGSWRDVAAAVLTVGDYCQVKLGETIPQDGVIVVGETTVDEAMLTGEPLPSHKMKGDTVYGGTINRSGTIEIEITSEAGYGVFDQMISLVEKALKTKAPIELLVDKIMQWFVPVVIMIATVTMILWMYVQPDVTIAIRNAIAVLVIACPCALGIATPAAVMAGAAKGAKLGILLKDGAALEAAQNIDLVLFDKTGTLTEGRPVVSRFTFDSRFNRRTLIGVSAGLEASSEHSLAKAIVEYAKQEQVEPVTISEGEISTGFGVRGVVEQQVWFIGSLKWHTEAQRSISQLILDWSTNERKEGASVVYLANEKEVVGAFAIADEVRSDAVTTIERLRGLQIDVGMMTGDHQASADAIAALVGIDQVMAEVLPTKKAEVVKRLMEKGYHVAFVGDGVNDAPALATATLGIAMGSGTDIAKAAGQMVILGGTPSKAVDALLLSKETYKIIKQNIGWAFGYNLVGMVLAAFGYVHPAIAGIAMAVSSVSVLLNSLRIAKV